MEERGRMDGYGKRILVIGDDVGSRAFLEDQLDQEGYAVLTACDGVAGADEMRKRHFMAVIADDHMPGFSGIEFAEFCRAAWPDTPVILFSSDLSYVTNKMGEAGVAASMCEPCEATMLLRVLRKATQTGSIEQSIFSKAQETEGRAGRQQGVIRKSMLSDKERRTMDDRGKTVLVAEDYEGIRNKSEELLQILRTAVPKAVHRHREQSILWSWL
jgi:DNA-binding response OmpR family regulator